MIDALRSQPKGSTFLTVTITVDGIREFSQADRISKQLRATGGVIWSRDLKYSAGTAGAAGGIARYEIAWNGAPDALRARLAAIDPGLRMEATRIEGNRWNYHLIEGAPSAPPPPVTPPPPPPAPAIPEQKP
jgi:hypothetical protein